MNDSGRRDSAGLPKIRLLSPEHGQNSNHRQIDGNASEPSGSVLTISQPQSQQPQSSSPPTQPQQQKPAKISTASVPIISPQPRSPTSPQKLPPSPHNSHPSPKPSSAPSRTPNPNPGTTLPPGHPPHHYPPTGPTFSTSRPTSINNISPAKKAELDRVEWQAVDAAIRRQRECPGFGRRVWGWVGRVCGCAGCGGGKGTEKEKEKAK